ncbi:hypothetical protein EDD21DRAFT_54615 [Dissophora ornata]|nr:hypothetical protein EDD21DRAFT_54615 [Dissophora ornata]
MEARWRLDSGSGRTRGRGRERERETKGQRDEQGDRLSSIDASMTGLSQGPTHVKRKCVQDVGVARGLACLQSVEGWMCVLAAVCELVARCLAVCRVCRIMASVNTARRPGCPLALSSLLAFPLFLSLSLSLFLSLSTCTTLPARHFSIPSPIPHSIPVSLPYPNSRTLSCIPPAPRLSLLLPSFPCRVFTLPCLHSPPTSRPTPSLTVFQCSTPLNSIKPPPGLPKERELYPHR